MKDLDWLFKISVGPFCYSDTFLNSLTSSSTHPPLFSRQNYCILFIHSFNQALWALLKIQFANMFFYQSQTSNDFSNDNIFLCSFGMLQPGNPSVVLDSNGVYYVLLGNQEFPSMITKRIGRFYSLEVNSYYLALFLLLLQGGQKQEIMYLCNIFKRKYLSLLHC